VVLQTREGASRKQQVDRDALGQCIAARHFRDASG
jgi:hypothetical protein